MFSLRILSLEGTWSSIIDCNTWSIEFIDSTNSSHLGKEILNSKFQNLQGSYARHPRHPLSGTFVVERLGFKEIKSGSGSCGVFNGDRVVLTQSTKKSSHTCDLVFCKEAYSRRKWQSRDVSLLRILVLKYQICVLCISLVRVRWYRCCSHRHRIAAYHSRKAEASSLVGIGHTVIG